MTHPNDFQEVENARVGYQVAVDLWIAETTLRWSKFNAMLVANSLVLAALAFCQPILPAYMVAIAGLWLCAVWFLAARRGSDYHDFYIANARSLEERHLKPAVLVSDGARFSAGDRVTVKLGDDKSIDQQMSAPRWVSVRVLSLSVVWLFVFIYLRVLFAPLCPGFGVKPAALLDCSKPSVSGSQSPSVTTQ